MVDETLVPLITADKNKFKTDLEGTLINQNISSLRSNTRGNYIVHNISKNNKLVKGWIRLDKRKSEKK